MDSVIDIPKRMRIYHVAIDERVFLELSTTFSFLLDGVRIYSYIIFYLLVVSLTMLMYYFFILSSSRAVCGSVANRTKMRG